MKSGLWWKAGLGIISVIVVIWVIRFISTPSPGTRMEDQGREHKPEAELVGFAYNSNPPTSGPHLETWVKPGVYTTPQVEGQLIHSLEHGYVVIHYNCGAKTSSSLPSFVPRVYADHPDDDGKPATHSADLELQEASASGGVNQSDECKLLQSELETLARRKNLFKLVVVPRPGLDTRVALTAWNYIDKFNEFDAERIEKFIDYHRDHGPEQTME